MIGREADSVGERLRVWNAAPPQVLLVWSPHWGWCAVASADRQEVRQAARRRRWLTRRDTFAVPRQAMRHMCRAWWLRITRLAADADDGATGFSRSVDGRRFWIQ